MKVALYHNLPSGGALRVIDRYLALSKAGHRFELFLPSSANREFINLDDKVDAVHVYPVPPGGSLLKQYRQLMAVPKFGKMIAHEIDDRDFDVVLCTASFITQSPAILPYLKAPSLYYAPEYLRAVYDQPVYREYRSVKERLKVLLNKPYDAERKRFDRMAIKHATKIFTHSRFTAGTLKGIYDVPAEVIALGVDSQELQPGPKQRDGYVLSVGALHPAKGHQFVIEALATLPAANRPPLVVIGDRGAFGAELQRLASRTGVKLTVKQAIPYLEVVQLYQRATVLAAGQYAEPFGLITLEAMACQTPVVAVAEGGLAETVTADRTGLLVERDPQQFAAAIRRVFDEPDLAKKLGEAGRADVERRWRWEVTADRIDSLLDETTRTKR